MLYAISAWFDEVSENRIRGMWKEFYDDSIDTIFYTGPYRPHITLALFDTQKIDDVSRHLHDSLLSVKGFYVSISSIGFFNQPPVLFLNVALSQNLHHVHSNAYAFLISLGIDVPEYYSPNQWTPHISLGVNLSQEKLLRGVKITQSWDLPLKIHINRLGIVSESEKQELEEIHLTEP